VPAPRRIKETHAWQCGYCTAGIVMKAVAILGNSRETDQSTTITTRQELASSLDANLCRCGAHPRILDALEPLLNEGAVQGGITKVRHELPNT